jgi:hypothetical protein
VFLHTFTEHASGEIPLHGLCANVTPESPAERLALDCGVETPTVSVQPRAPSGGPLFEIEDDLSRLCLLVSSVSGPAAFSG